MVEWGGKDNREYGIENREEIMEFRFYVFTCRSTKPTTSGGDILRCTFLPAALLVQRPPVAGTSSRFTITCYFSKSAVPFLVNSEE